LTDQHKLVLAKANEIEYELKRLNRWDEMPLPEEKFENMGAFGSETMSFEQWIQFVLVERIHEIVKEEGAFPSESNVGVYAVRVFDTDPYAGTLTQLLSELDALINSGSVQFLDDPNELHGPSNLGGSPEDLPLPAVVYQLADVLALFEGDALESALQTFDVFLENRDAEGRKAIAQLLFSASDRTISSKERLRIGKAAMDVEKGDRAAAAYNHEEAMRKYQEEFRKNYPDKRK
jgi:uncharacterized protein YqcC (DUF446 family)